MCLAGNLGRRKALIWPLGFPTAVLLEFPGRVLSIHLTSYAFLFSLGVVYRHLLGWPVYSSNCVSEIPPASKM